MAFAEEVSVWGAAVIMAFAEEVSV